MLKILPNQPLPAYKMSATFKPTDEERQTVRHMSAAGIPEERIARAIRGGLDPKTLRKWFRSELDLATSELTALAVGQLVRAINRGELAAIFFFLKCRAHWHEKAVTEVTGAGGGPLIPTSVKVVLVPAAKQIVDGTAEPVESGNGRH